MAKAKSKSVIMVPDGVGGMAKLQDHRFERSDWPIRFDLPEKQANTWLQYLSAECTRRGWNCSSIQQLDSKENSASITINTGAGDQRQLVLVWERKQSGPMKLRARSVGGVEFSQTEAVDFFNQVNERNRTSAMEPFYLRGQLSYDGLPWRGELWLGDTLRLGPPSKYDETVLFSARIILVDAIVEGIDWMNSGSAFQVLLRELSVFLSVVIGSEVRIPPNGRAWVWTAGPTGQLESCDMRNLGYYENDRPSLMPDKNQAPAIPMIPVPRPDFSHRGIILGEDTEFQMPADIIALWRAFNGLSSDQRQKFLQVGSMWQLALSLGHEFETARFVWMVNACEALKPPGTQFRDHNIYHVADALLGRPSADLLQEQWFRPQEVRNAYLHSGQFRGSEFVQHVFMSSFQDPTFGQAYRVLAQITPAAIIEWLRRGGRFSMPPINRRKSWRRWVKDRALVLMPIITIVGVFAGLVIGWLLRIK